MVIRYRMYSDMQTECYCEMDEREDGGYVAVNDYNALAEELERTRACHERALDDLSELHDVFRACMRSGGFEYGENYEDYVGTVDVIEATLTKHGRLRC